SPLSSTPTVQEAAELIHLLRPTAELWSLWSWSVDDMVGTPLRQETESSSSSPEQVIAGPDLNGALSSSGPDLNGAMSSSGPCPLQGHVLLRPLSSSGTCPPQALVLFRDLSSSGPGPRGFMLSSVARSLHVRASACQGSRRSIATIISGNKTSKLVRERLKSEVEKMSSQFSGFRPSLVVLQVGQVVLQVGLVVLLVGLVVLQVGLVVLQVGQVVLQVGQVVLQVGLVVIQVGLVVLQVGLVVIPVT
ncbi:hypothetical protein INR49_020452, partial [Caranx melampygus]